ncbi:MAG: hypothetical protein ACFFDT_00280 [Candidatus Hodarchaeota archaeon]
MNDHILKELSNIIELAKSCKNMSNTKIALVQAEKLLDQMKTNYNESRKPTFAKIELIRNEKPRVDRPFRGYDTRFFLNGIEYVIEDVKFRLDAGLDPAKVTVTFICSEFEIITKTPETTIEEFLEDIGSEIEKDKSKEQTTQQNENGSNRLIDLINQTIDLIKPHYAEFTEEQKTLFWEKMLGKKQEHNNKYEVVPAPLADWIIKDADDRRNEQPFRDALKKIFYEPNEETKEKEEDQSHKDESNNGIHFTAVEQSFNGQLGYKLLKETPSYFLDTEEEE